MLTPRNNVTSGTKVRIRSIRSTLRAALVAQPLSVATGLPCDGPPSGLHSGIISPYQAVLGVP